MNKEEFKTWLLTHAGVESEYNRNLITNTAEIVFGEKKETKKFSVSDLENKINFWF